MAREPYGADDVVDLDDPGARPELQDPDDARDIAAERPQQRQPPHPRLTGHRRTTALLALAVVGLLAAAVLRDTGEPTIDGPPLDGTATAEQLFPLLAEEPADGTVQPTGPLTDSARLVPGSARLLGTTATVALWVTRQDDGGVCLLSYTTAENRGLGGTCGSAAKVAARGLRLPAGGGGTAVLVPAGADTTELREDGRVELAPHLWVDAETAEDAVKAAVVTASRDVVVPAEGRTGDDALPIFLTEDAATYAVVVACLGPATLEVSVDQVESRQVPCSRDANFLRFEGDGGPTRVDVAAPEQLVWAGGVVACAGSLVGPVC